MYFFVVSTVVVLVLFLFDLMLGCQRIVSEMVYKKKQIFPTPKLLNQILHVKYGVMVMIQPTVGDSFSPSCIRYICCPIIICNI